MMPMQSAPDGESVAYQGQPFSAGLAAGPNEYLSHPRLKRLGDGEPELADRSTGQGYEAFSQDLSRGVLAPGRPGALPGSAEPGRKRLRQPLPARDEAGSLEPLVTIEPPHREPGLRVEDQFMVRYAGANAGASFTPAFSHLIFEANDALTEEVPDVAPEAPNVAAGQNCAFPGEDCNLYEWVEGELRLVNVLPGNDRRGDGGGGDRLGAAAGGERPSISNPPTSTTRSQTTASRIFWSEEESGQVYVRVNGEETLEVPGPGTLQRNRDVESAGLLPHRLGGRLAGAALRRQPV